MGLDPSLNLILVPLEGKTMKEEQVKSFVRWTVESSLFSVAKSNAKRERKNC